MSLLEVKNLRVEFPTRRGTLLAIDDISFSICSYIGNKKGIATSAMPFLLQAKLIV